MTDWPDTPISEHDMVTMSLERLVDEHGWGDVIRTYEAHWELGGDE